MAIQATHLRFRQAPMRREAYEERPARTFSLSRVIPMDRLNAITSDAKLRLHATSVFMVGIAAIAAALAIV
ncbi:MAG: hypothetical protein AB7P33_13625 [Dehalococcoidia bacterium]